MIKLLQGITIDTLLLLIILMMMFGEYSHRYYKKTNWGENWKMQFIAPFVYYASGTVVILCIILLVIKIIGAMI